LKFTPAKAESQKENIYDLAEISKLLPKQALGLTELP